ncbi:MAG: hypothetical protein UDP16_07005 [Collinsella sp.]|nr:hypothetical protein [Collinsella sp.]
MEEKVRYVFEAVDGSYVETDDSAAFRISETFGFTNEKHIKILEKGTEKLGKLDGTEYYIASPVTFVLYGRVYYTLGDTLFYMPELESVYLGGYGR